MPLFVDGGLNPVRWAGDKYLRPASSAGQSGSVRDGLTIALINNMPDSALEETEYQFFELLDAAAGDLPIHVQLFSLPKISRSDRAQQHLDNFYASTAVLLKQQADGVIITGTEPRQPDLRNEPYWGPLTEVLNWAEDNTHSTVLSCLAAHAGVLHSDDIRRNPLGEKRFGVFQHKKVAEHPLTRGMAEPIRIPHSRWNEVKEEDLSSCGYLVLTKSAGAGVDLFVKEKKKSLFVHFQGHPEYISQTLHKEYRRDVKRYLRWERETYPLVPEEYFDRKAVRLLSDFRVKAEGERHEDIMENFPEADVVETLQHSWQPSAAQIYRNWLNYLASRKANARDIATMVQVAND